MRNKKPKKNYSKYLNLFNLSDIVSNKIQNVIFIQIIQNYPKMGTENRIKLKFYQVPNVIIRIKQKNQNSQTETKFKFINNQTVHISLEPNRRTSQLNWHKLKKKNWN